MGDYFKPFRRKIAVVTLAMACVFVAGWVRSAFRTDELFIRFDDDNLAWIVSNNGWCGLVAVHDPIATSPVKFSQWKSSATYQHRETGLFAGVACFWDWNDCPHLMLPYAVPAIPLTLLAAFLLFSNPRPTKSANETKPAREPAISV